MDRTTLYSGNVSVLLAIIFFMGASSDIFADSGLDFMKEQFKFSASILLAVTIACSISLFLLIISELYDFTPIIGRLLFMSAYIVFIVELFILLYFTFDFIMFLREMSG